MCQIYFKDLGEFLLYNPPEQSEGGFKRNQQMEMEAKTATLPMSHCPFPVLGLCCDQDLGFGLEIMLIRIFPCHKRTINIIRLQCIFYIICVCSVTAMLHSHCIVTCIKAEIEPAQRQALQSSQGRASGPVPPSAQYSCESWGHQLTGNLSKSKHHIE